MSEIINRTFTPDRRTVLKGFVGGAFGANLTAQQASAETHQKPYKPIADTSRVPRFIWKLERPKPALPNSYFWTWDHSTNWMLDDPGMLNWGCNNTYMKNPETYLTDYRRLTDMAAGLGVKGILIWGFIRDSHGGIDYAKRVADYAAANGVAIMPGVGTNHYGGIYYEGNHKYNLETFAAKYPDARQVTRNGDRHPRAICPSYPGFVEWQHEAVQWLFKEFAIGGANLENGDFGVCYCPRCKEIGKDWVKGEPAFWMHQYYGYNPVLRLLADQLDDKLITWATYKGFLPGKPDPTIRHGRNAFMECDKPALIDKLPSNAMCQWTLTGMLKGEQPPLLEYLDNGAPEEILDHERWPKGIKPPTKRSVGFMHQGSQWVGVNRYQLIIGYIKQACLRAYRAGMEGVSIHGEVSSVNVTWALNYLAYSHFIHWPEDSLRDFGRKTLSQVLGSEDEGEAFVELLAHIGTGWLKPEQVTEVDRRKRALRPLVSRGSELTRWRFWDWMHHLVKDIKEPYTVSTF